MSVPWPHSTHAKHWTYGCVEQLVLLRCLARERATETLDEAVKQQQSDGASTAAGTAMHLKPLPNEDEALLCAHWEAKMQAVCRSENACDASRFTDRTLAAAQLYFKRFFLVISPMQESMLGVMLTALYLAGKVEEEHIEIDRLVVLSGQKMTARELLALEMRMLEVLRFELLTRSPFRCLGGLLQDLHGSLAAAPGGSAVALAGLEELRGATTALVKKALCADTPLLFSPLQVHADGGCEPE